MGVDREQVISQPFVAGTMFYARVSALQPLLNLSIDEDEFEQEAGQVDGTLAHAIERTFSIGLIAVEKKLVATDFFIGNDNTTINKRYVFASPS